MESIQRNSFPAFRSGKLFYSPTLLLQGSVHPIVNENNQGVKELPIENASRVGNDASHVISDASHTAMNTNRIETDLNRPKDESSYKEDNIPNQPDVPTVTIPTDVAPTKPKRQNPLFVGPVEADFDINDPYFNHHGNLTSFMATYTALHNNITRNHSNRQVVFTPMKETGLGNSLLALSSSFFYAVLTKRAFLMNYKQFTKHFTFPFAEQNSTYTCTFFWFASP